MGNREHRTPPGDPSSITLTYEHRHYWWFSADDAPETWHVSADIGDGGPHVGDLDITLVDTYETQDPFALLDGQDAELGHVAAVLFDAGDGRLTPTSTSNSRSGSAAGSSSSTRSSWHRSGGASAWARCWPGRRSGSCRAEPAPRCVPRAAQRRD